MRTIGQCSLHLGDCLDVLAGMEPDSVDACVTDPPYHLTAGKKGGTGEASVITTGFMGQQWDGGDIAFRPETWAAVLRVLKPGGHLLAFSSTRTQHRMVCAIEDAGFEIRDQIGWAYGSGFPKSRDISKDIDRVLGAKREIVGTVKAPGMAAEGARQGAQARNKLEFDVLSSDPVTTEALAFKGWGTALKPAWEPICVARKPLKGTVAANVLAHGTGALNIDGCRIDGTKGTPASPRRAAQHAAYGDLSNDPGTGSGWDPNVGRWPANLIHDGGDEVLACFPDATGQQRSVGPEHGAKASVNTYGDFGPRNTTFNPRTDSGSAARFFYCAKASASERGEGNDHPTVKPIALMRHLCRLVTPKGGLVLDPFAGSGTTGLAAFYEGFRAILIEREERHFQITCNRIARELGLFAGVAE